MEKINKKSLLILLVGFSVIGLAGLVMAAATTVPLGAADGFAILANSTITNTGATVIDGDLGLSPGTSVTNFPPGTVINGIQRINDATAIQAQSDLTTAYNNAAGQGCDHNLTGQDLGGMTLTPGVYCFDNSAQLTGTLTLNGQNNPDSVFIFQIGTTLTTASNSSVVFTNDTQACHVFWKVGSSATLGTDTAFQGNILALASATLNTRASVVGRVLASTGAITLDTNTVTKATCAATSTTLHIIKHVVNTGGGTATASLFNLHVKNSGGSEVASSPAAGAEAPGTTYSLASGTYTVSEDAYASYTQSFSGDCNSSGSVVLSGVAKTCTITNTYVPPASATLHVIKLVVDGAAGSSPSDFTIHVKDSLGAEVASSPAVGAAAPGTAYSLSNGTYTVSENTNTAYTQSFSGACDSSGSVTLAGVDKTCTIINTNVPVIVASGGGTGNDPRIVPLIGILKVPSPLALPAGSGSVTYDYTVWNIAGQQPLVNVTVVDDKCSPLVLVSGDTNNNKKIDTGEKWKYSCTANITSTTTNTAIATGYSDDTYHQAAIATAIATVVVGTPSVGTSSVQLLSPPLINIVKVPSRLTPFPYGGGDVKYTYTVTNPGVVAMHDVVVTDNKCSPVTRISGDTNNDNLLDINETWTYNCQTNIKTSTMNTATAEGKANGYTAIGYAFTTVLVSSPGLPKTGTTVGLWDMVAFFVILVLVSITLVAVLKKRKANI